MLYPDFIGPSYQSRSLFADAEQCVNLYPETVESGAGKNKVVLYPTPGLTQTGYSPGTGTYSVIPGCIMAAKTVWNAFDSTMESYVAVTSFTGVGSSVQTISLYNTINNGLIASVSTGGTTPPQAAFIACSGTELLLAIKWAGTGSRLYRWDMTAPVPALNIVSSWNTGLAITGLDYLDGFFTATTTSALYASASGDGNTWNALNFVLESDEPDGIVGHVVNHRLIWIFGKSRVETFYNAGGADFPFQRVPQGVMETGCVSAACVVSAAESLFWIGMGKGGGPVVFRSNGYTPVRVSTHAIEQILQKYLKTSDVVNNQGLSGYAGATGGQWAYCAARAYTYTQNGHTFVVFNFGGNNLALLAAYGQSVLAPDPTTTIVYDVTENAWHERQFCQNDGTFVRHLANFYLYDQLQGQHVVSDYRSAVLYYQQLSAYTDNGSVIWRWRTAPHLSLENQWMFYSKFILDLGVDDTDDETYIIYLQWSDDAGKTWSTQPLQLTSDPSQRAIWRRLGKSRNRIFKVSTSMRGQFVWINAFLNEPEVGAA